MGRERNRERGREQQVVRERERGREKHIGRERGERETHRENQRGKEKVRDRHRSRSDIDIFNTSFKKHQINTDKNKS